MIPGNGEPFDGINAGIFAADDDYENAGLSAGGMIPVAGWAIIGGKYARYLGKAANAVPTQLIRGQNFEKDVLAELGLVKNTKKVNKCIPDSLTNGRITEIKDVQYVYKDAQMRAYLKSGMEVDLVVSLQTKISKPLYKEITKAGGSINVRDGAGHYSQYVPWWK